MSLQSSVPPTILQLLEMLEKLKPLPQDELVCPTAGWESLKQHFPAETYSLPERERFCGLRVTVVADATKLGSALFRAWDRGSSVWLVDADKAVYFPNPRLNQPSAEMEGIWTEHFPLKVPEVKE